MEDAYTVESRVKSVVAEALGADPADLKMETTFEDLGGDSLDQVEIIIALEDEFGLSIDDGSAGKIMSVQQAIDYVTKHASEA